MNQAIAGMITLAIVLILQISNSSAESNLARFEWQPSVAESSWEFLVLHHSATLSGSVASIDSEHKTRRDSAGNAWLGIGYHFVIGNGNGMPDGKVQATFRWEQQIHGAHSGHALFNSKGIGICLIGNFEDAPPSRKQLSALRLLVKQLGERYQISSQQVMSHADIRPTSCPGRFFPMAEINKLLEDD